MSNRQSGLDVFRAQKPGLISLVLLMGALVGVLLGLYLLVHTNHLSIVEAFSEPAISKPSQASFQLIQEQMLEGCVDMSIRPASLGKLMVVSQTRAPIAPLSLSFPVQSSRVAPDRAFNKPARIVHDPYPVFAGLAVDSLNDKVVVADQNTYHLFLYDRAATGGMINPLRKVGGKKTKIMFIAGVDVDPQRREMYTINNDIMDNMVVFSYDQSGDVTPIRDLSVPHGSWGVSVDRDHGEVAVTTQHTNRISVYRQTASGKEAPLRVIQGPATGLADPHGIFIDSVNEEMVVSNHGSWHLVEPQGLKVGLMDLIRSATYPPLLPSTGQFEPPSLIVLSRTGDGNARPLRTIRGPRTQLNLPLSVSVDQEHNEIVVANDGGNSILFFDRRAEGDAAPVRTIKGSATGLKNPAGVSLDLKNNEIWVSNWGNRTITVYPLSAEGNVAPLRTFTVAPPDEPMAGFGNPGAVAYDPVRDELLVPN